MGFPPAFPARLGKPTKSDNLRDEGRGGGGLVLPVWRKLANPEVVPGQAADARLDKNQAELGNTVRVTQHHTNLGRGVTLLGELADVLADLLGRDLEPRRRGALVRNRRAGNILTRVVH